TTAAEPPPTPVTSPVPSTVAAAGSSLVQVIARPGSTFPFASRAAAESRFVMWTSRLTEAGETVRDATGGGATTVTETVSPAAPTVTGLGEMSTEAGGPVTTTTNAAPVNSFNLAVTVYEPVASAATSPVDETVRPLRSLLDHVRGWPINTLPAASCTVAV